MNKTELLIGVSIPMVVCFGLLGLTILANSTFDARCARIYSRDTAEHERCVIRASAGDPLHEENVAILKGRSR